MLSKKDLSGEMRAECIDKIKKSVDRISKIVNGLRKFSRSSESLQLAEVKLFSLVKESIDLVMTKSKKHNVEVRNLVDEQIILNIDEIQIEQVLINLISNAIDANDSHDQAWVEISNDSNNDFDLIIVKDSGQGIKEKDVDRLFDPFFTTKDIGKGTGLGLSVSQSIAKEHGGNLYYQFLDGNTSFVLKIPKHQNKNVA
jgi:C4-dicarboxylate-specific signal transduction histidine kinase